MGEIGYLEIAAQLDYSKTTLTQLHEYIYALRDRRSKDKDGGGGLPNPDRGLE